MMLYLNVETNIQNENEQYFAHSKQLKWIWFNSIAISPPKQVIVWFLKAFFSARNLRTLGEPPKKQTEGPCMGMQILWENNVKTL